MKLVVDIFGGDNSPIETVAGAVDAINERTDLELVLTGSKEIIESELAKYTYDKNRIEIVDAPEVITCNESPTEAVRKKPNSSLVEAYRLLKTDETVSGLVSAGSTGAVLTGAILKLGRIKGISRPALAPILPTVQHGEQVGNVMLIDCGANVDCKPINLVHFAIMGSVYMQNLYGIDKPRVALLSNGVEDKKGCELTKTTFEILKSLDCINFVGNMEARDIVSGNYDVIVSDGFYGNVALKSIEGAVDCVMGMLKHVMFKSLKNKIGAALLKSSLYEMKDVMDYNKKGGAVFLGVEKIVVKSHGSSKRYAFKNSILQALTACENGVNKIIKESIDGIDLSAITEQTNGSL